MKIKLGFAALLAAFSLSAYAGDLSITAIADGKTHSFEANELGGILSGGLDLITLDGLGSGTYKVSISITGQELTFDLTQSNLHGVLASGHSDDGLEFLGVKYTGPGPFVLELYGTAGSGADYAGTYRVTAVPEPVTYTMLLGGLALVGAIARRKNQAT